ncbi:MAG TPA: cytochrome c [Terracidiphilus sp.]|nr:cytochrome c [Terracidiphilus sp.]
MFKPFLLLTAVVLFGFVSFTTPALPQQHGSHGSAAKAAEAAAKNSETAAAEAHAKAKELYQRDCALCHGASGNGQTEVAKSMDLTMSDWSDPKSLAGKSDQALFDAIRKGTDKMPPEDKSRASDDEVHAVITYIRSLAKQQPAGAPAPAAAPTATPAPATAATPAPGN